MGLAFEKFSGSFMIFGSNDMMMNRTETKIDNIKVSL